MYSNKFQQSRNKKLQLMLLGLPLFNSSFVGGGVGWWWFLWWGFLFGFFCMKEMIEKVTSSVSGRQRKGWGAWQCFVSEAFKIRYCFAIQHIKRHLITVVLSNYEVIKLFFYLDTFMTYLHNEISFLCLQPRFYV